MVESKNIALDITKCIKHMHLSGKGSCRLQLYEEFHFMLSGVPLYHR